MKMVAFWMNLIALAIWAFVLACGGTLNFGEALMVSACAMFAVHFRAYAFGGPK